MSKPEIAATILLIGATFYAVFGGADFGAGMWELLAGRSQDPERVRERIKHSLAPVWEANHVWLIFILVVLWTAFPEAFSAVMTTLYIPLSLAAVGIVLRGSGFAFGKVIEGRAQRQANLVFSVSSILTPFFMGCVVGAIASGEVPAEGNGDPMASWTGLLPLVIGAIFVVAGAYIAAVFLVRDSRAAGEDANTSHFARCSLGAAVVAGALAIVGILALDRDARFVYDGLTGAALPLVIGSAILGLIALGLLVRLVRDPAAPIWGLRPAAVGAFVTMIWGWGVAQHPYLLPPEGGDGLTIDQAASPDPTLNAVLIVFAAALLIVIPSIALLYTLAQRDVLE